MALRELELVKSTPQNFAPQKFAPQYEKMSYAAYLEIAGESQIVEWKNGEVIRYMPPLYKHQDIVRFLTALLDGFVQMFNLGLVCFAPLEVKLWPDGPAREPDILFISQANRVHLTPKRYEGGPDLVIEVISRGSVAIDRVDKFREYEQAGVREYWLIDPRPHQEQAEFYLLGEDGVYVPGVVEENGRYTATILPHFWLNLAWLRQPELPNPQRVLAEIMITVPTLPAELRTAYETIYRLLPE